MLKTDRCTDRKQKALAAIIRARKYLQLAAKDQPELKKASRQCIYFYHKMKQMCE